MRTPEENKATNKFLSLGNKPINTNKHFIKMQIDTIDIMNAKPDSAYNKACKAANHQMSVDMAEDYRYKMTMDWLNSFKDAK